MEARRGGPVPYELVILSDHGQVETRPFAEVAGAPIAELLARMYPGASVEDLKEGEKGQGKDPHARFKLAHSGGLSHLYVAEFPGRLQAGEFDRRVPGLAERIAAIEGIDFVLLREGDCNVAVTREGRLRFGTKAGDAARLLGRYDEADIVAWQLDRLNSSAMAGDAILFAGWKGAPGAPGSAQYDFEE